jgi:hypothetical protein
MMFVSDIGSALSPGDVLRGGGVCDIEGKPSPGLRPETVDVDDTGE